MREWLIVLCPLASLQFFRKVGRMEEWKKKFIFVILNEVK